MPSSAASRRATGETFSAGRLALGRGSTGPAPAGDAGDRRADGNSLALSGKDLEQPAVVLGFVAHRRLVGLDLDERLATREGGPGLDEPLQDDPLLHGVGEAGHRQVAAGVSHARR
jgi:hypothetical protein